MHDGPSPSFPLKMEPLFEKNIFKQCGSFFIHSCAFGLQLFCHRRRIISQ